MLIGDLLRELPAAFALGVIGRAVGDWYSLHGYPLLACSVMGGLIGPAPFIWLAQNWLSRVLPTRGPREKGD